MKLHGKKALIFYFVIMLSITLLSNTIYYSVMNWVPNMLYEVFAMPQSISILLTISLPCTSVVGGIVAINYCEKVKNIINVSIVMHLIATIIAIPFAIIYDVNIVLSIVLLIIFNCISAGVRGVFGGVMAFKMRTQINAGSYAAISNAVAALAAGFIPPLAGSIIDSSLGYQGLYWIVAVVCVVLFAVLIGLNASYKKKYKDKTSQANNGCC